MFNDIQIGRQQGSLNPEAPGLIAAPHSSVVLKGIEILDTVCLQSNALQKIWNGNETKCYDSWDGSCSPVWDLGLKT